MLANGPPWMMAGLFSSVLDEVGVDGVLQQSGHSAGRPQLPGRDGLAVVGVGADDAGQALLEVGQVARQAEDGHDLAGDGDVKAVLTRGAVHFAAQAIHQKAQLAVVHIHAALPGDAPRVDVQRVALLDGVVDHGGQQVVGGADGVDVAGKVQVDVFHRHDLRIAAAGRAALDAEHRAQRRLAQAQHRLFAQGVHGVGQADARRGLALAGRRRADGCHQDQLALRAVFLGQAVVDLGFVVAVGDNVLPLQAQTGCDLGDGLHFGGLGNFDVAQHSFPPAFSTQQKGCPHCIWLRAAQTVGFCCGCLPCGHFHINPSVNSLIPLL